MTLLVLAAVGILVALAVADALRPGSPSAAGTSPRTTTERAPSISTEQEISRPTTSTAARKQVIRQIGNRWAELFAAGRAQSGCFQMTQPACERVDCVHVGGAKVKNCEPLATAFQRSFEASTVQDIVIRKGYLAAVTFSNGEVVEFLGDGGTWRVSRLGEDVPSKFFD